MEENLIAQNPKDELVLKINNYVDTQASAADNSQKISVYSSAFVELAKKYFGLDNEFLKKLNDKELANLSSLIYEKAKRRLWIHVPAFSLLSLISTLGFGVGIILFYFGFINKRDRLFCTYKFVILHKWFWQRFAVADLRKGI